MKSHRIGGDRPSGQDEQESLEKTGERERKEV